MKNKTRNIIITLTIIAGLLFTNTVYASFAEMDDATSDKQRNEQLQEQEQQDKENLEKILFEELGNNKEYKDSKVQEKVTEIVT